VVDRTIKTEDDDGTVIKKEEDVDGPMKREAITDDAVEPSVAAEAEIKQENAEDTVNEVRDSASRSEEGVEIKTEPTDD